MSRIAIKYLVASFDLSLFSNPTLTLTPPHENLTYGSHAAHGYCIKLQCQNNIAYYYEKLQQFKSLV